MITVDIRVSNHIEMLHEVIGQAADYGLWSTLYGKEWKERVDAIKASIDRLYAAREDNSELEMHFNFAAAQLLKKAMFYYIQKNYKMADPSFMEELTNFIVTIDDRIESDLADSVENYFPGIDAWNKQSGRGGR